MATMTEDTIRLNTKEMAEMCGVTSGYISVAAHGDYLAGGVRVCDYKVMHWKGNRVSHYEVPRDIARQHFPRDRWNHYDINPYQS